MTKAYSYLRFSTPEQMKGNSFARQYEKTTRFCQKHGLELGSGLIDQSQKMTAAAMQMADMKVWAHRS